MRSNVWYIYIWRSTIVYLTIKHTILCSFKDSSETFEGYDYFDISNEQGMQTTGRFIPSSQGTSLLLLYRVATIHYTFLIANKKFF